jgi:hypothetical protein
VADLPPIRGSRGRLELLAQIGSLIATAWIVGNVAALPRAVFSAPASVVWRAVEFTLLAWMWSAAVALVLQFAIRRVERVDLAGATLRTSRVAIWFAPATLLLYRFSVTTVIAALVLVVNATRLLYSQWRIIHPAEEPAEPAFYAAILLGTGELPTSILSRHLGPALSVAMGLQIGISAALFRHHFLAGTLLTLSVAMLTVFAISTGAWESSRPPTLPRAVFGMFLTVLLAVGLTILATGGGGSGWAFWLGSGGNGDEASAPPLPSFFVGRQAAPSGSQTAAAEQARGSADNPSSPIADPEIPGAGDVAGSFPGVILWPEIKPVTLLIAPMPTRSGDFAARAIPYGIPFGGEYWFFRPPFFRPPPRSFRKRGTPAKVSFSTTDRWPLNMEAHQKLEPAIDTSCCSRIQLAVSNADRYPNTVSLELILRDLPDKTSQSLGTVPVTSAPNLETDPVSPVGETLEFMVPPEPRVRMFNELTVVYHRDRMRWDKSARVAIERFILIPRGR